MINLDFNIGDSVGEIYKRSDDKWVLLECKITSISITRKGITIKAPKSFNPLDGEELMDNTKDMQNADGYRQMPEEGLCYQRPPFPQKHISRAEHHQYSISCLHPRRDI